MIRIRLKFRTATGLGEEEDRQRRRYGFNLCVLLNLKDHKAYCRKTFNLLISAQGNMAFKAAKVVQEPSAISFAIQRSCYSVTTKKNI